MMSGPKRKFGFLETFNFFETKPRGKMRSRLYLQTQKLKAKKKKIKYCEKNICLTPAGATNSPRLQGARLDQARYKRLSCIFSVFPNRCMKTYERSGRYKNPWKNSVIWFQKEIQIKEKKCLKIMQITAFKVVWKRRSNIPGCEDYENTLARIIIRKKCNRSCKLQHLNLFWRKELTHLGTESQLPVGTRLYM